jgi:hypothetical protein
MEMIKTSALKLQKITERRQADLYSAQASYMHRDKGNTAADSEIRTAVLSIRKGVGNTLVHEMSHSSDRTGRSTGERLPITDVKKNSNVLQ